MQPDLLASYEKDRWPSHLGNPWQSLSPITRGIFQIFTKWDAPKNVSPICRTKAKLDIYIYTHIHILIAKFDSISDFFQDADHDLSGQTHNNPPKIRKVWFTEIYFGISLKGLPKIRKVYFRIGFAATIPTGQERFVAILESGTSEAHGTPPAGPSRAMGGLTFKTSSWLGLHQGTKVPGICS